MLKTLLGVLLTSLLTLSAYAQYELSGKITDENGKGVPFSSIALAKTIDSSTLQFTVADEIGSFKLKGIDSGNYLLVVASVGYDVEHIPTSLSSDITAKQIVLTSGAVSMKEVMIRAKSIPILMNGDTVVYNSSSFKTQSNANVENLIRKLPGVNVGADGSLTAEGEQVTRVLINGKEFFGGNVEAATKNLDAALVDKVEVIDKKRDEDEFTDENTNETEKVINLVLKEEHAQGYFGNIRAGYGPDDIYDAHGNINFFRDATQLSIIGGSNNVNQRLYGWRETRTLNNFEINPMNNWTSFTTWNSGISTNNGIGANLHVEPLEKMKVDVSYIVTDVISVDTNTSYSELYFPKNTQLRESNGFSENLSQNHRINGKIELEPDSLNKIVIRVQAETQSRNNEMRSQTFSFLNSSENLLNSAVTENLNLTENSKFISKIHWTKKSKKNKENYWVSSIYFGSTRQNEDGNAFFNTADFRLTLTQNETPIINQALKTSDQTIATTLGYQFRVTDKFKIRPGINWMGTDYQHSFDWVDTNEGKLQANSPSGEVRSDNLEYYVHFIYQLDSFTTLRLVPEINQMIERRDFTTDVDTSFSFNQYYFIPYFFINSRKQHNYNFYLSLRANVNRPQTQQFLPVTDTRNPYNVSIGNIRLVNNMNYSGYANFRKMLGLQKSLRFYTWSRYNLNPVIARNTVDENGYAVRELINNKYSFNSSQDVTLSWPLKFLKATSEIGIQYSHSRSFTEQNEIEIEARDNMYRGNIGFNWYDFDKISFEIDYGIGYNSGTIAGVSNNGFITQDIYTEAVWNITDRLEWSVDFDLETYSGSETAPAQFIPILSSQINYSLDTLNRWTIGIKGFDILDKNTNISRSWSQNSFRQFENLTIRQYFMATIRYNIKKPKGKSKDNFRMH